ncbi:MAG TPA: cytochrome-c oxidase, cbb3-type subunit II [Rickettsiales bacterium]|nr:cytochrome-c oxidase, cbb3-type subunit II [Rickettsiales bacterium]
MISHGKIERNSMLLLILAIIVVSIGGMVEILPLFRVEATIEPVKGIRPLTPLELAGENIYIRENCAVCHSQQIRSLRSDVARYGHYSLAAESMYDHPFLWGSKRIGPDIARLGGKYSDAWHVAHLMDPRSVVPESIMPTYSFLMQRGVDLTDISDHLKTLRSLGVPYTQEMIDNAYNDAITQANNDADSTGLKKRYGNNVNVRDFDDQPAFVSEMDALVAYLQQLGTQVDFKDYNPEMDPRDKGVPAKDLTGKP